MGQLVLEASTGLLDTVLDFVDARLEEAGCPAETRTIIAIACEEIFVNIAHYAYGGAPGPVTVDCRIQPEPLSASIQFADRGKPYDPFSRQDPDITLSAEDRAIGGLGIFMVKEMMDEVGYEYRDEQNILTLVKRF